MYPNGAASDADQDIAAMLIFADRLVKCNIWSSYTSMKGASYAARASDILNTIRTAMVDDGRYLNPGDGFGSKDHLNPGYFAPAFYRIFAEFDKANAAAWLALIEGSYEVIAASPGYAKGLLMDWCTWDGKPTSGEAGYNGYRGGVYQYRDAIRVYWRLATDYLWYGEQRAKAFLDNAIKFLGSPDKANFYDMSGNLPPATDGEMLSGGTIYRTRREYSHLTLGMWAAAAMGSGGSAVAKSYSDTLLNRFYAPGRDFFGQINIPETTLPTLTIVKDSEESTTHTNVPFAEDTLRNEMYFDQFLAWFGASILSGLFTNVWEDLKDGGPLAWKTKPPNVLPNWNVGGSPVEPYAEVTPFVPFHLGASFNRSSPWTVTLTHDSLPANTRSFTGNSDTVNVVWHGLNAAGEHMPQGWYTLVITAQRLTHSVKVWLGKSSAGSAQNIIEGRWLLIDNFADGDLVPYIGSIWQTYSDKNNDDGNSDAVMTPVAASGNNPSRLDWNYTIRGGAGYPFVALDWVCQKAGQPMNLSNVDSIIIIARSGSSSIDVSLQLIDTNDPNDYHFFEDTITLSTATSTASKTHALRLSSSPQTFQQRLSGSGRNFATTLSNMRAIRFHMQYGTEGQGSSDAIILEKMYLAAHDSVLTRLYKPPVPPPDYRPPTGLPDIIRVTHQRSKLPDGFSIKRSRNNIRITIPKNMAGAGVSIVNIRGRVVKRIKIPQNGMVDITTRDLAAGMYFVEIKKRGVRTIRTPLNNVK